MSRADRLEAEAALLRLEEEFVAKKASGEVTTDDKLALREARREFRAKHRTVKPGAAPAPIGG